MKKWINVRRVVAIVLIVIVSLVVILGAVFIGLQISGKNSLYGRYKGVVPAMNMANNDKVEEITQEEADDWQEGDIRYDGVHYRYNEQMLTFLFMGIDSNDPVKEAKDFISGGQSDSMILLALNPVSNEVSVIPINRDTMATVERYNPDGTLQGEYQMQITLQHAYGDGKELSCERSVKAVSRLFYDLPIHGYCAINMGAIPIFNDAIGGVTLTAIEDIYPDGINNPLIKKGEVVTLNKEKAYWYVKFRDHNKELTNPARLERQKQYLKEFGKQLITAIKSDLLLPVSLYNQLSDYMVTDISLDEITYLATEVGKYSFPESAVKNIEGETITSNEFEEFHMDEESLFETILSVFYQVVED